MSAGWVVAGVLALLLARQVWLTAKRDEALADVVRAFIVCRDALLEQAETEPDKRRGAFVVPPDFIGEDGGDGDIRA